MKKFIISIWLMLFVISCSYRSNPLNLRDIQTTENIRVDTPGGIENNLHSNKIDNYLFKEKSKISNIEELKNRLKRLKIRIEKVEKYPKENAETVFDEKYEPIKNIMIEDRRWFRKVIEGKVRASGMDYNHKNIIKLFPVVKDKDFKNTGKLLYQPDFDIFLSNIFIRTHITPVTPEHFHHFMRNQFGVFSEDPF